MFARDSERVQGTVLGERMSAANHSRWLLKDRRISFNDTHKARKGKLSCPNLGHGRAMASTPSGIQPLGSHESGEGKAFDGAGGESRIKKNTVRDRKRRQ